MTRSGWVALLLWLASFLFSLATLAFLNDHFGRISPAREIVQYGELPFRDFFDPGYFLTELASAALLWLLGDNLLGEALLTTSSIATGTVLVFRLANRITGSIPIALSVSIVALLSAPRAYDYDKILFYPLGLLLCWRYVERPVAGRLWQFAAGLVIAALFRYDTGVYLAAAGLTAIAVAHAGRWTMIWRRAALLLGAVALLSAPAAVFVQLNGGIGNAIDQIVTYGRRETARTTLSAPSFSLGDPMDLAPSAPADATHAVDTASSRSAHGRIVPRWWTAANANAVVYYFLRALPLAAVLVLLYRGAQVPWFPGSRVSCSRLAVLGFQVPWLGGLRRTHAKPREPENQTTREPEHPSTEARVTRGEVACVLSLATLCLVLNVFILRDPISARAGGMAGPAAILSAWLFLRAWQVRNVIVRASVAAVSAFAVWGVLVMADWHDKLSLEAFRPTRVVGMVRAYAVSPRDAALMPSSSAIQMVPYLRECTAPTDRVLLTWFAPEVYFFAQRGFAAGMVAVFGGHWSEQRFQARSVELLSAQSVPVVIRRAVDPDLEQSYPLLDRYVKEHYRYAGTSSFGDTTPDAAFDVLVRADRTSAYVHPITGLPCFQ